MSAGDIRISHPAVARVYSPRVILVHRAREGSIAFDVFCPEDCPVDPCDGFGYGLPDCPWARRMAERGYVYRCSEDLAHLPEVNAEVVRHINWLVREHGFAVEFAEEGWE